MSFPNSHPARPSGPPLPLAENLDAPLCKLPGPSLRAVPASFSGG